MGLSALVDNCRHMLSFFGWFLLRCLPGFVFALLQKVNMWHPQKRLRDIRGKDRCVVRARVMLRWKSMLVSEASFDDFLLWSEHELFPFDVLFEQNVSLYCITADAVVFVRTSPGSNCYNFKISPFYLAQYFAAEEVYVTSHLMFLFLSSELNDECQIPVTWLSSTGRCGSTILTQIMEGIPGTVCISEPDAVLNVAMLHKSGQITPAQKLSLLRGAINFLLFHAVTTNTRRIFIKPRSECSVLIEDIYRACPQISQVFMYRRLPALLKSFKQKVPALRMAWARLLSSDVIAAVTPYFRNRVFSQKFNGTSEEKQMVADLVPNLSFLGILTTTICSQINMVQRVQAEEFSLPVILYEDLLADPVTTVVDLVDHIHLSRDDLTAALSSLSNIFQGSVPGSDSSQLPPTQLTARERRELETVLSRFDLPESYEEIEFIERLGEPLGGQSRN